MLGSHTPGTVTGPGEAMCMSSLSGHLVTFIDLRGACLEEGRDEKERRMVRPGTGFGDDVKLMLFLNQKFT